MHLKENPHILAIKLRELGDTVFLTASLDSLREMYPKATIDVLVLEAHAPILKNHSSIDRIWTLKSTSLYHFLPKFFELRRVKPSYDLVLAFHASQKISRVLRLFFPKAIRIVHHHSLKKTPSSSSILLPRPGNLENIVLRDHQLLEALGYSRTIHSTSLVVTREEKKWAESQLPKTNSKRWVALLPGGSVAAKRYPLEHWRAFIVELSGLSGVLPILICDPAQAKLWSIRKEFPEIPLFDNVNLREMMALIDCCDIAIGNDSGPIHVAAALKKKTITLFGPTCLGDYHPYSLENHRYLRSHVDCRPHGPESNDTFRYCTLRECWHQTCLKQIAPSSILREVHSLMVN